MATAEQGLLIWDDPPRRFSPEEQQRIEEWYSEAKARHTDPDTSHRAAQAVGSGVEKAVLAAFSLRDWTGEELAEYLTDVYGPTAKSARSRLSKWHKGRAPLLKDSGVRRPSHRGRDQIVWTKAT